MFNVFSYSGGLLVIARLGYSYPMVGTRKTGVEKTLTIQQGTFVALSGLLKSLSVEFFGLTNFEKKSKLFEKCLKYPNIVH